MWDWECGMKLIFSDILVLFPSFTVRAPIQTCLYIRSDQLLSYFYYSPWIDNSANSWLSLQQRTATAFLYKSIHHVYLKQSQSPLLQFFHTYIKQSQSPLLRCFQESKPGSTQQDSQPDDSLREFQPDHYSYRWSRFMVHKVMVHKVHGSPWWFVYTIAPIISRTTTPGTSRLAWCSLLHRITPRVLTSIFSVPPLLPIHPSVYLLLKVSTG